MVGGFLIMRSSLPKNFRDLFLWILLLFLSIAPHAQAKPSALSAEAAMQTATSELNQKHYDEALKILVPVLQANPEDPELLNLEGAILTKQDKFEKAQVCFDKALQTSPGFFAARYNIGAILALEHKWKEAIDYYRTLLLEQPNNELVEYKLLLLLLHQDADPELQAKLFATDLPTNTPAWYFATAARHFKKGDSTEAEKYLDVARNIYGDQTAIYQEELDESGLQNPKK